MKNILSYKRPTSLTTFLVTWGGVGYMRPASGTWGSLAALPFAALILFFTGPLGLLAAAAALYKISFFAVKQYEKKSGTHDSSDIVVDEVIGMFIALAPAMMSWVDFGVGFILFRAFDAIKPGPIGWADKTLPGAHGVLLDDVLAGIAAATCLMSLHLVF